MNSKKIFDTTSVCIGALIGAVTTAESLRYAINVIKKSREMKSDYKNVTQEYLFINNMDVLINGNSSIDFILKRSFIGMDKNVDVIKDLMRINNKLSSNTSKQFIKTVIRHDLKKIGKKYHNSIFSLFLDCTYHALLGNYNSRYSDYLCNKYNDFFLKYMKQFTKVKAKASLLSLFLNL